MSKLGKYSSENCKWKSSSSFFFGVVGVGVGVGVEVEVVGVVLVVVEVSALVSAGLSFIIIYLFKRI